VIVEVHRNRDPEKATYRRHITNRADGTGDIGRQTREPLVSGAFFRPFGGGLSPGAVVYASAGLGGERWSGDSRRGDKLAIDAKAPLSGAFGRRRWAVTTIVGG
jgi:hypothetical protein